MRPSTAPVAIAEPTTWALIRAWLWSGCVLLALITLLLLFNRGYVFNSSIMALLPVSEQSVAEAIAQQRLIATADQRALLLIKSDRRFTADRSTEIFAQQLRDSQLFTQVQGAIGVDDRAAFEAFYQPHRYQLLSVQNRLSLQAADDLLVKQSLGRLYSPLASLLSAHLVDDPLQLFFQWQASRLPATAFSLEHGWLTREVDGEHYRLLTVELNRSPFDSQYQRALLAAVAEAEAGLPANMQLLRSGLVFHAAKGAEQARGEITTIGLGSFIGVLILLWSCFRSLATVLLAFIPIAMGSAVALALSMLWFEQVHLITLAFGAGLVGVAIDYSLHYICASKESQGAALDSKLDATLAATVAPRSVLRRVLPSLALGLFSSVLAYGAQGLAPFPGLQQMAFFSVIGLVAAWLTVVCWFPLLLSKPQIQLNSRLIEHMKRWQSAWPNIDNRRVAVLTFFTTVGLIIIVNSIEANDDLRLLQTSPAQLLQQDITVQSLLAGPNSGQYFVVEGTSEQDLLSREEAFSEILQGAVTAGWISGFTASSQFVPSHQRQRADYQLQKEHVYSANGRLADFAQALGYAELAGQSQTRFAAQPLQLFNMADLLAAPIVPAAELLWLGEQGGRYYSLITVSGLAGAAHISSLAALVNSMEAVSFVDRVANITNVLSHYRGQLLQWLQIAYGVVFGVLLLRYGRQAWRVIAAPSLASLITLSVLHLSGSPLTVFHGLALLLVLGIGLDASIFLQDSNNSPYAWLAISLSALTTLLAFGLLALSATPVLKYFGETVLVGILSVWLLAPCFVHSQVDQ